MTILNVIPVTKASIYTILVLIGLIIGLLGLIFAVCTGKPIVGEISIIILISSFIFFLICGVADLPDKVVYKYQYEVTIENFNELQGYKIIERRGNLYVVEKEENYDHT